VKNVSLDFIKLNRKNRCCITSTILVYILFFVVLDFQDDIAEHIKTVKEFLLTMYDTVDGAGKNFIYVNLHK